MTNQLAKLVGLRIKESRERAGLTQAQLAALLLKSAETISNLERGKTAPSLATLGAIARQLRIEVQQLFLPAALPLAEDEADAFSNATAARLRLLSRADQELVAEFVSLLQRRQTAGD